LEYLGKGPLNLKDKYVNCPRTSVLLETDCKRGESLLTNTSFLTIVTNYVLKNVKIAPIFKDKTELYKSR